MAQRHTHQLVCCRILSWMRRTAILAVPLAELYMQRAIFVLLGTPLMASRDPGFTSVSP